MVCAFLARIGGDVYELQRPEIGELREPRPAGGVSSITMPHKRNPEASEHLATLARLVRGQSGVLLEAMDQQHERDGRGWKSEWIALPEVCELTVVALTIAQQLLAGLEIDAVRMRANVDALGEPLRSEHLLARLPSGSASTRPRPCCRRHCVRTGPVSPSGSWSRLAR